MDQSEQKYMKQFTFQDLGLSTYIDSKDYSSSKNAKYRTHMIQNTKNWYQGTLLLKEDGSRQKIGKVHIQRRVSDETQEKNTSYEDPCRAGIVIP